MGTQDFDITEGDVNSSFERAVWQRAALDEAARSLLARDERHFLGQALSTPCLNALRGCEGSYVVDTQGRRILDFHGNSAHQIGYGNARVLDAIKAQLDALSFSPRRYTNEPAIRLAQKLSELSPTGDYKVLFAPAGALAVGMALKLARIATGRHKTISFRGAFHGASLDAISVGGEDMFREGMGPLLPGAFHVSPPRSDSDVDALLKEMEVIFEREGDIGAVVAEPIRCTTVLTPPAGYWPRVRELCDRFGALLVFDEIPLCLGRTGKMFSFEHFEVMPDMFCIGKGLGGGVLPLAAMLARPELDVASAHSIGHFTHEKNPVTAAAGLATIQFVEDEGLLERSVRLGTWAVDRLNELKTRHAIVGDVRGIGLLMGVELWRNGDPSEPAVGEAEKILYECLSRGLSFKISGGNVLTLTPPLTIGKEELSEAFEMMDAAMIAV